MVNTNIMITLQHNTRVLHTYLSSHYNIHTLF